MPSIAAGVVLAVALSAPPAEVPPPVLYCYSHVTESGTVARREFKDAAGHVVKEIFYAGPAGNGGPPACAEGTLRVQRIRTFEHDMDGRPIVMRVFGPEERMEQQSLLEYEDGDPKPVRSRTTDPTGVLLKEIRWKDGKELAALGFDDEGRVALVEGQLPPDVPYAIVWGPEFDGWTCGVSAVRREGPAERLRPAVHLRNVAATDAMARFIRRFDAEILDQRGRLIHDRGTRPDDRVGAAARLLWPREAAYREGPDLRERFGRLDPGRYRLLAWHPHPATGALLECGTLELLIK